MFDLELKYKGERAYIHATDMFQTISEVLEPTKGGSIKRLTARRVAHNQLRLHLGDVSDVSMVVATGIWMSDQEEHFWLEEIDIPVAGRYPYNEAEISADSMLVDTTLTAPFRNEFTMIECVVALTKRLNNLLSPKVGGQWYFGQIDLLSELPETCSMLQIRRHAFIHDVFSRNRIQIDGSDIGEIRFAVGPK